MEDAEEVVVIGDEDCARRLLNKLAKLLKIDVRR